jgi:hypothetical protein
MGHLRDALQLGAELAHPPEHFIKASKPFGLSKCPVLFRWILWLMGALVGMHIKKSPKKKGGASFFNIIQSAMQ